MNTLKLLWKHLKDFRRSPKKIIITVVLGAILIALSLYSYNKKSKQGVDYKTLLSDVAISVEGQDRTFRELAFYVAYEEATVEEQAKAYDSKNPEKYWNLHTDGVFVRIAARNAAAQMALHDEVFYQMAMESGIELNEEEEQALASAQEDFWYDLTDDAKDEKLGVSQEDIFSAMERMAYAQKMQLIYANMKNAAYEDYDFAARGYEEMLSMWDGEICESNWEQLKFGSITLDH